MSNAERWAVFIEYLTDRSMRAMINEIARREEGIAMAGEQRGMEQTARNALAESASIEFVQRITGFDEPVLKIV